MGSANLDLGRSLYAARERGDFVSSVIELADPEIECVFADGPRTRQREGGGRKSGVGTRLPERLGGFRFEVDECRELDDERVLVLRHPARVGAARQAGWNSGSTAGEEPRSCRSGPAG